MCGPLIVYIEPFYKKFLYMLPVCIHAYIFVSLREKAMKMYVQFSELVSLIDMPMAIHQLVTLSLVITWRTNS
jgi:hypothetical protein